MRKKSSNSHKDSSNTFEGFNSYITGDTLIAVADGRNAVPIKDLEGTVYPIYTVKNGKVVIGTSINTCQIQQNAEIWKLILDDGSFLQATKNHLIMLRTQEYQKLQDLKPGTSLMPFNSYISNKRYRQIASNTGRDRRQYRLIAEHNGLIVEPKTTAIHHRDFNSFNDLIGNLQVLHHETHRLLHSEKMKGKNNPVNRMSKEHYKEVYKKFINNKGENNSMYGKKHKESTKALIGEKSKLNWLKQRDLMSERIKSGITPEVRGKISKARKAYALLHKKEKVVKEQVPPGFTGRKHTEKSKLKISQTLKGRIFTDEHRAKLKAAALARYNHKVVSVEFSHFEDVFNMSVEGTNNFGVITSHKDDRFIESSGIFIYNYFKK